MAFYNSISDQSNFVTSFYGVPKHEFGFYAKGYSLAASTLAQHLLTKPGFRDYEAYPVVFLYRQAFELYLKDFYFKAALIFAFNNTEAIDTAFFTHHKLNPFSRIFKSICKKLFPTDELLLQIADKIDLIANEFEQIDSNSYSYRYPMNKNGNESTKHHQVVNLRAFHLTMQELLNELDTIDFGLNIEMDQAQEIYELMQEAHSVIASEKSEIG